MAEPVQAERNYLPLYAALGYTFSDPGLLDHAMTHRSWCAENAGRTSNERLEFLGDSVLGMSITESLYANRPEQAEGDLAKARAEVVSTTSLARLARKLNLGELLYLGKGEELSGGRDKDSILADAAEATFAAVFVDGGWEAARDVVLHLLQEQAEEAQITPGERDFKTRLQEFAALNSLPAPQYEMSVSGPDHGRQFVSNVRVGETVGEGHGTSKKQAQQQAAQAVLALLDAGTSPNYGETGEAANPVPRRNNES